MPVPHHTPTLLIHSGDVEKVRTILFPIISECTLIIESLECVIPTFKDHMARVVTLNGVTSDCFDLVVADCPTEDDYQDFLEVYTHIRTLTRRTRFLVVGVHGYEDQPTDNLFYVSSVLGIKDALTTRVFAPHKSVRTSNVTGIQSHQAA
jgi:hypothetical protein